MRGLNPLIGTFYLFLFSILESKCILYRTGDIHMSKDHVSVFLTNHKKDDLWLSVEVNVLLFHKSMGSRPTADIHFSCSEITPHVLD